MATVIRIKRSNVSGNPGTLAAGELAYSALEDNGSNGGDRLYVGMGNETGGNAANHVVIGGKYFTDKLDHTPGTLTTSSAIITDADNKINLLNVDNLRLDDNTISTTNNNGNLILNPNGTGLVSIANAYSLPRVDGGSGYVLTTNGSGIVTWQQTSSQLSITADSGSTSTVSLLTDVLVFEGGEGIDTTVSEDKITITAEISSYTNLGVAKFTNTDFSVISGDVSILASRIKDIIGTSADGGTGINLSYNTATGVLTINADIASTTALGVASFNSNNFDVTVGGDVTIKDGGVSNAKLINSSVTFGSTTVSLGSTSTTLSGLTQLNVDNLRLDDNTLSSTNLNGNITLSPNGTGLVSIAGAYTLPRTASTAGYVLTYDGAGAVTFQPASSSLTIAADAGTPDAISLLTDTLTFVGGEGIDTAVTDNTITISAEDATYTNKGVAKFTSTDFLVTSGAVSLIENRIKDIVLSSAIVEGEGIDLSYNTSTYTLTVAAELATTSNPGVASFSSNNFDVSLGGEVTVKDGGITNNKLVNSTVTIGDTSISLGSTSTTLSGLTQVDINNIRITGSTISSTNTNGNIVLDPNGNGTVDVSGARISGVAEPTASSDAATKAYVDAIGQGLHVHAPTKAATTDSLATLTGGSVTYSTGTNGVGATLNLGIALTVLDGYTLQNGDRILVKNESNLAHNGIYTWATGGTVLTRAIDFDSTVEIAGGDFLFVQEGDTYANSGWVETETTTNIGTSDIVFQQFSGAGTFQAGQGLTLTGNIFSVTTSSGTGLYISGSTLQINPTLAGDGLTYNSGALAVGGTSNRITVTSDAVDIAATYVGQTSITTLGTISVGTWTSTTIAEAYGGTGQTTYNQGDILVANGVGGLSKLGIGAAGTVLQVSTSSSTLVYGDVDGGVY